ncbi:hypothetical protein TSAR_000992 [Trichomalopsis sarcophagae]|uniref:Uncharacterized protein n=1 Tax=Trichomalopsis sarcophagae TaxID=543379 RepID=A0A232F7E8_9HYME|nr:hypothetical protein TSAR_000992 [Trichomalopsis sarcophagae]
MVLNMYNKKKKVGKVCPNILFSVSPTRKWHFYRRILHIYSCSARNTPVRVQLVYKRMGRGYCC